MTNQNKTIPPTGEDHPYTEPNPEDIYYPIGLDPNIVVELMQYMPEINRDAILAKMDSHLYQQVVDQKFTHANKLQMEAYKAMNDAKQAARIAEEEQAKADELRHVDKKKLAKSSFSTITMQTLHNIESEIDESRTKYYNSLKQDNEESLCP